VCAVYEFIPLKYVQILYIGMVLHVCGCTHMYLCICVSVRSVYAHARMRLCRSKYMHGVYRYMCICIGVGVRVVRGACIRIYIYM
jgi:hypothetical protein